MSTRTDIELARQARLRATPGARTAQPSRSELPSAGSGWRLGVLRSVNVADQEMWFQWLWYTDGPPVVGNYTAYGDLLRGYPLVTAPYADYQNWAWPDDPITELTVPVLVCMIDGYWQLMVAFKADGSLLDPNEPITPCGFG